MIGSLNIYVPVYNSEKYLSECIESVINQSFPSFELLLVDDGSTDNSPLICNHYQKKDSRIRYFRKE
ncbi:MAG: glycosyltransferase family 2 protein, partial [Bacteroidales bacterium]|nr:glycosyltransferase family 2 protein [Bacteroidales bacterium]